MGSATADVVERDERAEEQVDSMTRDEAAQIALQMRTDPMKLGISREEFIHHTIEMLMTLSDMIDGGYSPWEVADYVRQQVLKRTGTRA